MKIGRKTEGIVRKLTHQEIAGRRLSPHEMQGAERLPVAVLLDNVRSLYNVGSIFRSSDGALARHIYLCGFTPAPPRREIDKTALGAVETVPWSRHPDPLDAVRHARSLGMKICVLEHTDQSVPTFSLTSDDFPLCLIVGNELTGVSPGLIDAADLAVEIPMYGVKQSLNAAVAYGIALFDFVRIVKRFPAPFPPGRSPEMP